MANILFILKSCDIGGVEIVTMELANKFVFEGHNVVVWSFYKGETSVVKRLDNRVQILYGSGYKVSKNNIRSLSNIISSHNIQIIINQWGLPYIPILTIKKAIKKQNVKIISVYHNDPLANERLKGVQFELDICRNPIQKKFLKFKLWLFYQITSLSMRYTYRNSDRYMILSSSFINRFKEFTRVSNLSKLVVQPNPITIDKSNYVYNYSEKEKNIIYVGRLNHNQKRVSRIVDVWNLLEDKFPDWQLSIIGDGPERDNLEKKIKELDLKHISIEGFRNPKAYYEKASILMLVSEFEGFPLVILEGMCYGVVPVVLGSYPAVYDIIDDKINGIIIPYKRENGFSAELMAKETGKLMKSADNNMKSLSLSAYKKSENFNMNNIYKSWNALLGSIFRE